LVLCLQGIIYVLQVMDELLNLRKKREEEETVDFRHMPAVRLFSGSSSTYPQASESISYPAVNRLETRAAPVVASSPLMTRRQLNAPFDSDSDGAEDVENQ
jgi:hypothetical protein